jgi:hypothetical protein
MKLEDILFLMWTLVIAFFAYGLFVLEIQVSK